MVLKLQKNKQTSLNSKAVKFEKVNNYKTFLKKNGKKEIWIKQEELAQTLESAFVIIGKEGFYKGKTADLFVKLCYSN